MAIAKRAIMVGMTISEFKKYTKEAGGMPNPGRSIRRSDYTRGYD